MAKDKATEDVVAIKKIRSLNEVQGVSAPERSADIPIRDMGDFRGDANGVGG
jgi:hypothetical protein